MSTVNGWILIPRDVFVKIRATLEPFILLTREYGKCVDVQVKELPKDYFDTLCSCPGIVHGCK